MARRRLTKRSPLAELIASTTYGPRSQRGIHAAGGPSPETLVGALRGGGMRSDAQRRLAAAIGVSVEIVRVAIEATARELAAAPATDAGDESVTAWARARLRGAP